MDSQDGGSLERLQGLYLDLVSLSESRLPNIERLWAELESHVEEFRDLLDKRTKNDESRAKLNQASITINDREFAVNHEFRQEAVQLADLLDLDELDAARLYLQAQTGSVNFDRPPLASSIIIFHQQRLFLLECLRLSLAQVVDHEKEETNDPFNILISLILKDKHQHAKCGSTYWRKCLASMADIETWLQRISDRLQRVAVVGETASPEFTEIINIQRDSLNKQHESLGAVVYYLVRATQLEVEDMRHLLATLQSQDRYESVVHYLPCLTAAITHFASSDSTLPSRDVQSLHQTITTWKDHDTWILRNFRACAVVLWLAEYSGRFYDQLANFTTEGIDVDIEIESCSNFFMDALRDGALHFMLAVCQEGDDNGWYDPVRRGFTSFLLQDSLHLPTDSLVIQTHFNQLLKKQFQAFAEAFISNMPDTLRKLKFEEDEQRRQMGARIQLRAAEYELHLERFLIIVSYAYDGMAEAANAFWSPPDGNLFGFLQWASQRQATPRVAAFCEMLRALSGGEKCANAAHQFLLEAQATTLRRSSPLSWYHIFNELEFYSSSIKERPAVTQGRGKGPEDQILEPESAMMLETYLRLLAHITIESPNARHWLLHQASFRWQENLILLCKSSIESRLRACALTSLTALLRHHEELTRDTMWLAIDGWVLGGSLAGSIAQRPPSFSATATSSEQLVFDTILTSFEEANSFLSLLCALIAPCSNHNALNDALPFPESLGSAYRMPGIEPYVDFALGRVLTMKTLELQDPVQLRIMRWNCLRFAATCLSTFNEDLLIFADRTSMSVDATIRTSSLALYARIHPFARVMEWFFNENVVVALFATLSQNIDEVNSAASDSPLVLGIMESIQVISLVLSFQSTYFNVVRPIVKLQSPSRKQVVANWALVTFEDAILNNINCVTVLGLYCGSGHQHLASASLRLIGQLSSLKRLAAPLISNGRTIDKSRLITALERHGTSENISRSLVSAMHFDERELEQGSESPGYMIKTDILKILKVCLETIEERPTVAHLFLGFHCTNGQLNVDNPGLFTDRKSLFHSIVQLVMQCPDGDSETVMSWLTSIRNDAIAILQRLWRSPLSEGHVTAELRISDFFLALSLQQRIISIDSRWDGRTMQDADFLFSDSAITYAHFIYQRGAFLEYVATELRLAIRDGFTTLVNRIQATMLGSTTLPNGQDIRTPTVFDFLDFFGLGLIENPAMSQLQFFQSLDFNICKVGDTQSIYNILSVEQLLLLRKSEMLRNGQISSPEVEKQVEAEAHDLLLCFTAKNNREAINSEHKRTLESWVQLVTVMLNSSPFHCMQKELFILQTLQSIIPKMHVAFLDEIESAFNLALLGRAVLRTVDFAVSSTTDIGLDNSLHEKTFQLFEAALSGIQSPEATTAVREVCCEIGYTYLYGISETQSHASARHHAIQIIRSMEERLMRILCDDADRGEEKCRSASLLLLDAIVMVSNKEASKSILEFFARMNFVEVIVDTLKDIPWHLQGGDAVNVAQMLSYYDATLTLLLRISQTRMGAAAVLNAGLFVAIRDSGVFSTDPDIGLDVDNPEALTKYYNLLLAMLRVANAIVVSRGPENAQTISQVHHFLHDHRQLIAAIFKRNAKIGGVSTDDENSAVLAELVDNFTVLILTSYFLESEEEKLGMKSAPKLFA